MSPNEIILLAICLAIMFFGLVGTLLPVLPGIPLVYAGYLVFGIFSGWKYFGLWTMVFWGVITALALILDYYAGMVGTKRAGASVFAVWGSVVGAILGLLIANLPGLVIGTFLGAYGGELWAGKTSGEAWRAGKGALLGMLGGATVKVIIGVIMIGAFLWKVLA